MTYPTQIPLAEIKNVVTHVKNGTVSANLKDFAHDAWIVQGYAQYSLIGEASAPEFGASAAAVDGFAALEQLSMNEGVSAQIAIPWKTILKFILDELLKNI